MTQNSAIQNEPRPSHTSLSSGKAPEPTRLITRLGALRGIIGLIALVIIGIVVSPRDRRNGDILFLQVGNIIDILRQVSEIGIIAIAMTFVVLTAGIDLSVGSTLAMSATVTGLVLTRVFDHTPYALHIAIAVLAGLAVGGAAGLVNGFVISRLSIQPFIMTLAAMMGLRGLARSLTNNTNIEFSFGDDVTARFADVMSQKTTVIACFAGMAIVFAVVLKKTVFGRYVRAIGDNEKAASYAGVPIARIKVWVYFLCGLLAGLAGVLHAAQSHQGNPNDGVAYELDAIAAVVIGGTSLAGGRGTIFGTIIGTLIIGTLTNILGLKDVDSNRQLIVKAVIIVLAVWAQSRKRVA
ncbi:MAG TPA: ABC transporter permease [Tepidisphaeraceae bacterium]|jgi:ribose transport system permease protein|nr:ABC transporter permease [Tepidisphaeraceae bacterium]